MSRLYYEMPASQMSIEARSSGQARALHSAKSTGYAISYLGRKPHLAGSHAIGAAAAALCSFVGSGSERIGLAPAFGMTLSAKEQRRAVDSPSGR
jgi:hypothetical protein